MCRLQISPAAAQASDQEMADSYSGADEDLFYRAFTHKQNPEEQGLLVPFYPEDVKEEESR